MFAYKVVYNGFKKDTDKFFGVLKSVGADLLVLARLLWLRDERYRGPSLIMTE